MSPSGRDRIRAGGGVVLRLRGDTLQVLLVHRPKYKDWSHPKGKADDGEKYADAALREVWEETGLHCRLGPRLSNVQYPVGGGREKKIKYWVMWPETGKGHIKRPPDNEVDDVIWVTPSTANELLTYEADRDLLAEALEAIEE